MPYVLVQTTRGASLSRAQRVTQALVDVLGKRPEHTHVVIGEVPEEKWGFAGMLTDEWRQRQAPDAADGA